ncbi:hypothetical protein K9U39_14925 [Rhodoblastus acidophilus]|uniref:Uncharacterized protein n=1 Tax=Candidatus Rhodoblastus alkanivorans TaxID=2954117 RepID=A0ABS9Z145_9HYPH|nr:hypothetical protein [Candidatus Rhodoblastus alkanivorans]MCI4680480.1 hypothetical protein [Candidatus Rhodoblastus alkanivorans]MCI4681180.1 hypothetical protein [Candidatus Rhodoblastus alkanivorans]MDI4642223.1 hypothetical protein [Rhodoblastus acidophilus]
MLGPVDLEGWLDGDEDENLRALLRQCAEIRRLRRTPSLTAFPGWSAFDFALARRFSATDYLDSHEMRRLAERLGLFDGDGVSARSC